MTEPEPERILKLYAKLSRPIMRRFMPANSCIAAARTTIECMQIFALRAYEIPVQYVFEVPARKYSRLGGFPASQKEWMCALAEARGGRLVELGSGNWNGHLIVAVEDRWLLDPSADQFASEEFGVAIRQEVVIADTKATGKAWHPRKNFDVQIEALLDNGDEAKLCYRSTRSNRGYLKTEAWTDEGLPILARIIADKMAAGMVTQ